MGYQTNHFLTIHTYWEETLEAIEKYIDEHEDDKWELYETYHRVGEPSKWYSHDEDMKELSRQFPQVLFELHGEGEKSGDVWKTYYKNGKLQHSQAELVFEKFDESKLV